MSTSIKKISELPPEPIVNAADEVFDSPAQGCPFKEEDAEDEEIKKIKRVYYTDSTGAELNLSLIHI